MATQSGIGHRGVRNPAAETVLTQIVFNLADGSPATMHVVLLRPQKIVIAFTVQLFTCCRSFSRHAVMQHGSDAYGVGSAMIDNILYMFDGTRSTTSDHRDRHGGSNAMSQFEVEAPAGALALDRGHHKLARSEVRRTGSPLTRIEAGLFTAIIGVGLVGTIGAAHSLDGHHDGGRSKLTGGFANKFGSRDRGRIDGDFISAGAQYGTYIVERTNASPYRKRNKDLARRAIYNVE